ncbi:MAG TPA: MarR family transcriptional regulator [Solirubrobacteraceae bacterium]|jgi:DNA-binding MarR family transcriptional regulator|nr:MarR family transcriptional regulator [Solirubrobacteraceae bacterium]
MQATTAPASATSSLAADLYALASYLMRRGNMSTFAAIAELDLSFTQIKALCALDDEGEERSVGAIAESLGTSLAAMSRAVDGLYERGLVGREEDPADRRMKRVRLTDAGRAVPAALAAGRLGALAELIESFDEQESRALAAALDLVVARHPEIAAHRPEQQGEPK